MKKRAVFTIARNEKYYLPVWLNYYAKYFNYNDMYVLDHQSSDGSTDNLPCHKEIIENEKYADVRWMVNIAQKRQVELLKNYNTVLFVHVDEIIVPNLTKYDDLGDYIDKFDKDVVKCNGKHIIEVAGEKPLDLSKPILSQRKYWYRRKKYNTFDKPLLSKIPLLWTLGWHEAKGDFPLDEDLYLVHLHQADYNQCVESHKYRAKQNHKHSGGGIAWHERITGDAARNFCKDCTDLEEIPEWIKDAV